MSKEFFGNLAILFFVLMALFAWCGNILISFISGALFFLCANIFGAKYKEEYEDYNNWP